ncbi:hypothetical protein TNIN_179361 [Trichonephila inaurata madagascariensis]|uniref:Uncharacterized protein n=1 Tax=Trichonephila inaurata madagascariensis TaxID=2747483 RepID=A0A8X7CJX7_9ARAC|nr:hypothetical protein TNIN_179361 [Trichonephila inaurata madagascariensis]
MMSYTTYSIATSTPFKWDAADASKATTKGDEMITLWTHTSNKMLLIGPTAINLLGMFLAVVLLLDFEFWISDYAIYSDSVQNRFSCMLRTSIVDLRKHGF